MNAMVVTHPHPRLRRYFPRTRGKKSFAASIELFLPCLRGRWSEGPEGVCYE